MNTTYPINWHEDKDHRGHHGDIKDEFTHNYSSTLDAFWEELARR